MWVPSELTTINVLINILGNFITSDYRSHIEIHENVRVVENRLANAKSYEFSTYAVEAVKALAHNRFPENFLFGAATGRIEGDYDSQGRGKSTWNYWTKDKRDEPACKSLEKHRDDARLVKNLGANSYRISLSWTRIMPDALSRRVSVEGVAYYNRLFNDLLSNGIEPLVTLHGFGDVPHKLQPIGGWTNPKMIDHFVDFARVAFTAFGDRVKYWISINDPWAVCSSATTTSNLEQQQQLLLRLGNYLCGHHVLLAHAKVYQIYRHEFQKKQNGKIGMSLKVRWFEPYDPASYKDIEAAEMSYIFANYWFVNPLLGERGNYHEVMRFKVGMRSAMRGLKRSRLPEFTDEEVRMIRGSLDFLGIDYFRTREARYSSSKESDLGAAWLTRLKEDIVADAKNFEKSLERLNADYILPQLIVTATGYGDSGGTNDLDRTVYYYEHLSKLLTCLKSGIDVRGYLAWSLMDSSSARMNSYSKRNLHYGLYSVDYNNANCTKTEKSSAKLIRNIYKTKAMPRLARQ
ncbi:myrosinase 1-like [Trichogramma pretiosum]|uniref:myrosinase 1-like n=1 Tax=Trichogramma pretiosum TaxID=7493 RepID=UPI0006C9A21A|nr:myrosinase 1-like [Trichogramma pretiosum]